MALADAGFELEVRDLAALRPHERTIPAHVDQMARQLVADKVQKDPILIDGRSGTVLDGMHRLAAFGALGIERAVCCSVEYASDRVKVGRWARVFLAGGPGELEETMDSEGYTRRLDLSEAVGALQDGTEGLIVALGEEARARPDVCTLDDAFDLVERMDEVASRRGWRREFVPEDEIGRELSKRDRMVMLVQRIRKDDVVAAATGRRLFPCKTSMHQIDPRPVAVGFPLDELRGPDGDRADKRLPRKGGRILPGGSTYEGRRYKERLLLLKPT